MPGDLKWFQAELPLVNWSSSIKVKLETLKTGKRIFTLEKPESLFVEIRKTFLNSTDQLIVRNR